MNDEDELQRLWSEALSEGKYSGVLTFNGISSILRRLNIKWETHFLKQKIQEFDIDHNKTISYDEFKEFYNSLFQRPEIREIFSCYAGNKNYLTQEEFSLFLSQKQKEYKTPHEVQLLMEKFERIASTSLQPSSSDSKVPCLSFRGFALYISGDDNSVFCPQHRHVYQDTSLPITHYWIASSHNTLHRFPFSCVSFARIFIEQTKMNEKFWLQQIFRKRPIVRNVVNKSVHCGSQQGLSLR
jgi:Ca2+-binding EF-hand superfamily protein